MTGVTLLLGLLTIAFFVLEIWLVATHVSGSICGLYIVVRILGAVFGHGFNSAREALEEP